MVDDLDDVDNVGGLDSLDNSGDLGDLESKTLELAPKKHGLKDTVTNWGKTAGDILVFAGLMYVAFQGADYFFPEKMNE